MTHLKKIQLFSRNVFFEFWCSIILSCRSYSCERFRGNVYHLTAIGYISKYPCFSLYISLNILVIPSFLSKYPCFSFYISKYPCFSLYIPKYTCFSLYISLNILVIPSYLSTYISLNILVSLSYSYTCYDVSHKEKSWTELWVCSVTCHLWALLRYIGASSRPIQHL